jgi:hypothetical protein
MIGKCRWEDRSLKSYRFFERIGTLFHVASIHDFFFQKILQAHAIRLHFSNKYHIIGRSAASHDDSTLIHG